MTEEKLCPIMSRAYLHTYECNGSTEDETRLHKIMCIEGECKAWAIDDFECTATFDCTKYADSGFEDDVCNDCQYSKGTGYCKLIDGGNE